MFFFKQKTAYELRISDWSSDVCSSDLRGAPRSARHAHRNDGLPTGVRSWKVLDDVEHRAIVVRERRLVVPARRAELGNRHRRTEHLEIGRASCRERVCQYV